MALSIRPTARTTTPAAWNLARVPHASAPLCEVAISERIDSRNHVLAARTLHGHGSNLDTVAPWIIYLQEKGGVRWILWLSRDSHKRHSHEDGFFVSIAGCAPRGPFFMDALLVPHAMRFAEGCLLSEGLSAAMAEATLDQPLGCWTSALGSEVRVTWTSGVPAQMFKPFPMIGFAQALVAGVDGKLREVAVTTCNPMPAYCNHCGKGFDELRKCAQCKAVWYCSKACQTAAWKAGHKHACATLNGREANGGNAMV